MKTNSPEGIECPINLFYAQEREIEKHTRLVNQAQGAVDKAAHAQEMIEAVNVLVDCQSYDQKNPSCQICRNISDLRLKTYNLIVKAGRMDESRRRSK